MANIEPKIEEEIKENPKENVDIEIPNKLKYFPHSYITEYYERLYKHVGGRVFSVLSLLPISLIIPKFFIDNKPIRSIINFLWLSPSGFAKSKISEYYKEITFNPLMTKSISIPRLYWEMKEKTKTFQGISLIVEDISVWFLDEKKIKFLEGISDEQRMSHEHMKNIKDGLDKEVNIVSFCSGTCENITNKRLKTGILRRFSPMIITLTPEEHTEINGSIYDGAGKKENISNSAHIKYFYQEIYNIQKGENKDIQPITGYNFDLIKEEAKKFFLPLGSQMYKKYGINTATESEQFFRFMICSAFLRIFEKKERGMIKDNILIIDNTDLNIAKSLIFQELEAKNVIYQCIDKIDSEGLKTRHQLERWTQKRIKGGYKYLSPEAKFIFEGNVKK